MQKIIIPEALQIVIDDLGWVNGKDDRENGGSSRTGMPRKHCYLDYEAIEMLGRELDQQIFCAFVVGEWDPDNRLAKFERLSKYGKEWNNKAYLDQAEMARVAEVVRNSKYIDLALHGVYHGYYADFVDNTDLSDYYYSEKKVRKMVDESEIRARLDAFFSILDYYGIKKQVTAFVPPSGAYRYNELSYILADYGIKYVSTPFRFMNCESCEKPEYIDIEDSGVITFQREKDLTKWDSCTVDFDNMPTRCDTFGSHWPNFLDADPAKNVERVSAAVRYFKRCSENIGCVLSKNARFAASQALYFKYAKTNTQDGVTYIDISDVPRHKNADVEFYVNAESPLSEWQGCDVEEYCKKKGFVTYKITPKADVITLK